MIYAVAIAGVLLLAFAVSEANLHSKSTSAAERFVVVLSGVLGAYVVMGAVQTLQPVSGNFRFTILDRKPGSVLLDMFEGEKLRSGERCIFIGVTAEAIGKSGSTHKATVSWPEDPNPGSTRQPGRQDFGWWLYEWSDTDEPIVAVVSYVRHNCGLGWPDVVTKQGPFLIEPKQ